MRRSLGGGLLSAAFAGWLMLMPVAALAEQPRALSVSFESAGATLSEAKTLEAISTELRVPVQPSAADVGESLRVRVESGRAYVAYVDAKGKATGRFIDLPDGEAAAIETIALLAGNVARDEAQSLLAALAPEPETPPPPPPPLHPPPPPSKAADARDSSTGPRDVPGAIPPPPPLHASVAPRSPSIVDPAIDSESSRTRRPTDLPAHLTLAYPVALDPDIDQKSTNVELGLFYSRVGRIDGFGLNPFVLRSRDGLHGASLTGLVDLVDGESTGALFAGIGGRARGDLDGVEVSGLFRKRLGSVHGLQLSGIYNEATELDRGAQLAMVNSAGRVLGAQVGLVNVAGNVDGAQVGLVNVADDVDGASVGLLSVTDDLRVQALVWSAATTPINTGIKLTNGWVYSAFGVGAQPENGSATLVSPQIFVGVHAPVRRFFFDADFGFGWDIDVGSDFASTDESSQSLRVRAIAGVAVTDNFGVFAGAGVRYRIYDDGRRDDRDPEALVGVQFF